MRFSIFNKSKSADKTQALIYQTELDYISKCILDYPDIETGGDLFGFWTHTGKPVVQYVIGPGQNCYRTGAFFQQDLDYLVSMGNYLNKNHGLQHIGSWHSHHKLELAIPSRHDEETMVKSIKNNQLNKFLMILGNIPKDNLTTINGYLFEKEKGINYLVIDWIILGKENPLRIFVETNSKDVFQYKPITKKASIIDLKKSDMNAVKSMRPLNIALNSWLNSDNGKKEMKKIHNGLEMKFDNLKMFYSDVNVISLEFYFNEVQFRVSFLPDFPNSAPIIKQLKSNDGNEIINLNDLDKSADFADIKADIIIEYISKYILKQNKCVI